MVSRKDITVTKIPFPTGFDNLSGIFQISHPVSGLKAILAFNRRLHEVALGGTRIREYPSEEAQVMDACLLSQGMEYKTAIAGTPFDGGKGTWSQTHLIKGKMLMALEAYAHGLEILKEMGFHILIGEDMNFHVRYIKHMRQFTDCVIGFENPAPFTARGILNAMRAAQQFRVGHNDLSSEIIGIQGIGNVGTELARLLINREESFVWGWDTDEKRREEAKELGVRLNQYPLHDRRITLVAPCAAGQILTREVLHKMRRGSVKMVVGAANNQLPSLEEGRKFGDIVYVPDFAGNSGGLITVCRDIPQGIPGRLTSAEVDEKIKRIYDTSLMILTFARDNGMSTADAAYRIAEERIVEAM